jgi:hypothetical protein
MLLLLLLLLLLLPVLSQSCKVQGGLGRAGTKG